MNIEQIVERVGALVKLDNYDLLTLSTSFTLDELPYAVFCYLFGCTEEVRKQECLHFLESISAVKFVLGFPVTNSDGLVRYVLIEGVTEKYIKPVEIHNLEKDYEFFQEEILQGSVLPFSMMGIAGYTCEAETLKIFYGVKLRDYAPFTE